MLLVKLFLRARSAIQQTAVLMPNPLWSLLLLGWCWLRLGASLYTLVAWNALRFGSAIAITEAGQTRSYRELQVSSERLAAQLFHLVGRARCAGLLCRSHLGLVEALLACGRLGLEVVLLNPNLSVGQLAAVYQQKNLDLILYDLEHQDKAQSLQEAGAPQAVLLTELRQPKNPLQIKLPPFYRRRAGRITVLTSGTTGSPKLVRRRIGFSEALGSVVGLLEGLKPRRGQAVLLTLPLVHGHGLATLALALAMGSPLYLGPKSTHEILESIEKHRIEVLVLVPTLLYRLLEYLESTPHTHYTRSLRAIICGSAPLQAGLASQTLKRLGPILYNLYGTSECGILTLATPKDLSQAPETVGQPLPGVHLRIASEQKPGHPQAEGEVLVSRGRQVLNTGDLGYFDTQGRLFLRGRADDLLICGGQNLYPESYESAVMEALDYVAECAVTGIPDPEYGQALHLWVVLKPSPQPMPVSQIEHDLARLFPRTLRPRKISLLEALPRNLAGKIIRRQLAPPPDK